MQYVTYLHKVFYTLILYALIAEKNCPNDCLS